MKETWETRNGSVYRSKDGAPIAHMDRTAAATKAGIYPVERDNNARLIAAAPEMLKALKWAKVILDGYDPPIDDESYNKYQKGLKRLLEAITKAEKDY